MTQDGGDLLELEELRVVDGKKLKYKLKSWRGCDWMSWTSGKPMKAGDDGFVADWHSVELVSTGAIYTDLRLMNTHAT